MTDIHREKAAELFGVPEEEVTDEQRRLAKTIQFGKLYGGPGEDLIHNEPTPFGCQECPDFEEYRDGSGCNNTAPCEVHEQRYLEARAKKLSPTGRVVNTQPVIQNIPIRTEEGRKLKEAFSPDQGWESVDNPDDPELEPGRKD